MKLSGPFMSLEASGSFANVVSAGLWRSRQWIKKKSRPKQPRTIAQRGVRARIGLLKTLWQYMANWGGEPVQSWWAEQNTDPSISPFNYMVRSNLALWKQNGYPILNLNTGFSFGGSVAFIDVQGQQGQITLEFLDNPPSFNTIGMEIYLLTAAGTPTEADLVLTSPPTQMIGGNTIATITHLRPGTYFVYGRSLYANIFSPPQSPATDWGSPVIVT